MLLVFSLDRPRWDGQMATRFLVSAEASDLPVTVVLNKADLVPKDTQLSTLQEVCHPGLTCTASIPRLLVQVPTACTRTEQHSSSFLSREGYGQLTTRAPPTAVCCSVVQHCISSLRFSGLQVEGWGYDAICVSASSGLGLAALTASLGSKVSVTAGPSGVGKSSIINALNASLRLERHPASHVADGQAAAADEQTPGGLPRHIRLLQLGP